MQNEKCKVKNNKIHHKDAKAAKEEKAEGRREIMSYGCS